MTAAEPHCEECGKRLSRDDTAIYRRLVNRGAETFLCMDCLARYFGCSRELIETRADYYKSIGCTLFL